MKIIIGIVLGIVIVFNWSSIKSYFDNSLAMQGSEVSGKTAEGPPKKDVPPNSSSSPSEPTKSLDLNAVAEQRLKDIAAGK